VRIGIKKRKRCDMFDDLKKVQESIVKLQKGAKNPFFKSKYVELNQVLEVVKPVLHENNFVLLQLPQHKLETGKNTLKTILLHSSGKTIESEIELVCADKNDPQKLGGAITYMRRYSIIAMLGLEQEDDDANFASNKKPEVKPEVKQPKTEAKVLVDDAVGANLKVDWNSYLTKYKVYGLNDLSSKQIEEIRKELGL